MPDFRYTHREILRCNAERHLHRNRYCFQMKELGQSFPLNQRKKGDTFHAFVWACSKRLSPGAGGLVASAEAKIAPGDGGAV